MKLRLRFVASIIVGAFLLGACGGSGGGSGLSASSSDECTLTGGAAGELFHYLADGDDAMKALGAIGSGYLTDKACQSLANGLVNHQGSAQSFQVQGVPGLEHIQGSDLFATPTTSPPSELLSLCEKAWDPVSAFVTDCLHGILPWNRTG